MANTLSAQEVEEFLLLHLIVMSPQAAAVMGRDLLRYGMDLRCKAMKDLDPSLKINQGIKMFNRGRWVDLDLMRRCRGRRIPMPSLTIPLLTDLVSIEDQNQHR
jgi:hypothetical protein